MSTEKIPCCVEGCLKYVFCRDRCQPHYKAALRTGELQRVSRDRATCSQMECDRPHFGHGFCKKHYRQNRGSCSVENCLRVVHERGWCFNHYRRWQKHGDPDSGKPLRFDAHLDIPDGYALCSACGEIKTNAEFKLRTSRSTANPGVRVPASRCKPCLKIIEAPSRKAYKAVLCARQYGISIEKYLELMARPCCDGCGIDFSLMEDTPDRVRRGKRNIDHCHETGVVRGVLCRECNVALGLLDENSIRIRKLADYIERFSSV